MLKLVVSQVTEPPKTTSLPREMSKSSLNEPFRAEINLKGPSLYIISVQDPSHFLGCELTLEIEQYHKEPNCQVTICHFPEINEDELNRFVEYDDLLFGIVMINFQMKILEQLLNFCSKHNTSKLIIYPDETYSDYLGIYKEFLTINESGNGVDETKEMIFPINEGTQEDWGNYMSEVSLRFQQILWKSQRENPVIKNYLKLHHFSNFHSQTTSKNKDDELLVGAVT